MSTEFLSYKEAAYYLNLPIGTVYALVSQKRIPHVRLGNRLVRFSKKELVEWVQHSSVELSITNVNPSILKKTIDNKVLSKIDKSEKSRSSVRDAKINKEV